MSALYKKLVVLDSVIFYPEHRERLEKIADEVIEYNTCRSEQEVLDRCRGADCIISCWVNISNEVIAQNPQLKTIAFWTHDYEHRIDKKFANERGIYVPAIPDYGTDSVAELVFIAALQLFGRRSQILSDASYPGEEVFAQISDDVRFFKKNAKDTLDGRWIHEYVKTGQLRLKSSEEIKEETLKGLTIGLLGPNALMDDLIQITTRGFRMNTIYSLADAAHDLFLSYRPVEQLLNESQVVVYDSRTLHPAHRCKLDQRSYLSTVDIAHLPQRAASLRGRSLGIVGLGRIGSRVAQIARDGFGMQVQYYSRTRKWDLEASLGIEYVELNRLIENSEILTFHLPHHGADDVVSEVVLSRIPKGTVVINASVGNVIADEEAFLRMFESGEITGYMDVYRNLPPRSRLRALRDNLLATYRLGWRTKSTVGLKTHKLLTKIEQGHCSTLSSDMQLPVEQEDILV